jgi:hypothetical protein
MLFARDTVPLAYKVLVLVEISFKTPRISIMAGYSHVALRSELQNSYTSQKLTRLFAIIIIPYDKLKTKVTIALLYNKSSSGVSRRAEATRVLARNSVKHPCRPNSRCQHHRSRLTSTMLLKPSGVHYPT